MEDTLDPDIAQWLVRTSSTTPLTALDTARAEARTRSALALELMNPALIPASEDDQVIQTPGGPLAVRVLRPHGPAATVNCPTIVYFHGGGWVLGDIDTHLGHARRICMQSNAVVVSVAYRLAPEHRFPSAFDDAVAATEWAALHIDELGGDASALIVAGDSAGGQLAASVAVARRDAKQLLAAQLLLYPVIDATGLYVDDAVNAHYMSRGASQHRFGLTLEGMVSFVRLYVDVDSAADWRVSPIRCADLRGVAPAVIHTATLDVLRTEGNFYADALREAGVRVISREFPTLNHSYFGLGGVSAIADSAAGQLSEDLAELLSERPA
jgi:acetyl esterase